MAEPSGPFLSDIDVQSYDGTGLNRNRKLPGGFDQFGNRLSENVELAPSYQPGTENSSVLDAILAHLGSFAHGPAEALGKVGSAASNVASGLRDAAVPPMDPALIHAIANMLRGQPEGVERKK